MWNISRIRPVVLLLLLLVFSGGQVSCEGFSWENYRKAVESGRLKIQPVQEMEAMFPAQVQNFIGHTPGTLPRWNSEVLLYDRYILKMQVPIRVNGSFSEVIEMTEEPKFYLWEVVVIEEFSNGQLVSSFGDNRTLGLNEWNTLVAADGDFSAIGIELKKDQPVEHFKQEYTSARRQREP